MPTMKLLANVQLKVLVVEDNLELAEAIQYDLSQVGFDVVCVYTGFEARNAIQEEEFDLILCDWRLPDFGGLDVLGFVKQNYEIPFILMTGFSDFIDKQDAYTSGASVFLSKPFNRTALHVALAEALGLDPKDMHPLNSVLKTI